LSGGHKERDLVGGVPVQTASPGLKTAMGDKRQCGWNKNSITIVTSWKARRNKQNHKNLFPIATRLSVDNKISRGWGLHGSDNFNRAMAV